ncbi:GNAT family N-acetyltransferase [Pontixanthobacter aquaemixtae]|uniref:GNAT family N-acetyltransferase n=1 Tax=Pontixanthobacter aquaemixtae TaxID=1958940 RepID=A0A844ZN95_9SPHN|nr:GNAT family N-acetyltransferase [Pontixanthobacter aquaemixtae]MXO89315.1 GNAT family N-acetyltransferase [Pontixanthobacter aquaemixtae]
MGALTPIKFVVGSKVLFSVPKALENVLLSLTEVIDGSRVSLPDLADGQDGYRILSAPAHALSQILREHRGLAAGGIQTYRRHYIDMRGSFDDYMARFSSKTRSTLRRKHRKLVKDIGGEVEFREYRTPDEMDEFRDLAIPLSRRTYQAKSLNAGLPEDAASHDARRALAAQDNVRAYLLIADGKPVSYLYLPIEGDAINYAFLGYDPDHARLSPGTVLQLEALDRLFAEQRYRYFDFTEGEGAHKAMFGTDSVEACSFFLLRGEAANRMLLKSVDAFDASVAGAKNLAERTGALGKIRGLLRAG